METLCGNQPGPRFAELSAWIFHLPGDPGTGQNRGNPGNPAMTSNTAPNRTTALLEHFQLNTVIEGRKQAGRKHAEEARNHGEITRHNSLVCINFW